MRYEGVLLDERVSVVTVSMSAERGASATYLGRSSWCERWLRGAWSNDAVHEANLRLVAEETSLGRGPSAVGGGRRCARVGACRRRP